MMNINNRLQAGANALMHAIQQNPEFDYNNVVRPDDRRFCSRAACGKREAVRMGYKTCAQCRYAYRYMSSIPSTNNTLCV
jgi:hypothetical protein